MNSKTNLEDVPFRANLWLQIALVINVYVSAAWVLLYGFHILYHISHFTGSYGILVIVAYILALCAEYFRLYEGYSGNLKAQVGDLSIFLVITPLIQLPLLVLLLLTIISQSLLLPTLIGAIFVLMLIQLLFGVLTWRRFAYHQNELYKLRRKMSLQMQMQTLKTSTTAAQY